MKQKIYNIEYFRIVLICSIILHHFYYYIINIWTTGWIAVEFFFVISGFVFAYTQKSEKSIIELAGSKLIRFLPLLSISAFIVAISTKFDLQKLFADVFLLPLTGLYNAFGYNNPGWFVSVYFWIFIFYSALLKSSSKNISNLIIGVVTFCALVIVQIKDYHMFRGIGAFGIGYFAYQICKFFPRNYNNKKSITFTIFELLGVLYFTIAPFTFYMITNRTAMVFQMGIVLILFYLKNGYISEILEMRALSRLSRYVLSVYLTHVILYIPILNLCLKHYYKIIASRPFVFSGLGILLSWLLGIFTYHFVQMPIEEYLKNNLSKCLEKYFPHNE